METAKKRLFSGVQPSGPLHIGNYFGALKQWLDHQEEYDCVFSVVDYHALTSLKDPKLVHEYTLSAIKDLLAIGIDPNKSILFQQSRVSEHTELAWILDCLVTVPFLELSHAYKDKVAKGLEANAGLFTYPMLMAADILLYDTDVVPVGEDQRQHVEYAREAAAKFNNAYTQTFKEPKEMIVKNVAIVPGTDGKKMSKSYGNTIPLFATKEEITKAVMSIVTDSSGERPENVFAIHKLFLDQSGLDKIYSNPTMRGKYKLIKEALIEDLEKFIAPMREKRANISDEEAVRIINEGSEKAKALAAAKMAEVRSKVGVAL
ncbi:MAG: Tryptophan--tRNA ligase [Patescibacteria group bacterium]|nr:Tryptophan--tRNA ligase [Patescibacteria group bacterium]